MTNKITHNNLFIVNNNGYIFTQNDSHFSTFNPSLLNPAFVALDLPSARLFITNGHSVKILDAATFSLISNVTGFIISTGIALDLANNRFFVADFGGASVSVIDATTYTITSTITGAGLNSIQGLTYDDNYQKLIVSKFDGSATIIDTTTLSVLANHPISGATQISACALDKANNRLLFVSQNQNKIYELDRTSYGLLTTYTIVGLSSPQDITVNASNDTLFVSDFNNNTITMLNAATLDVIATVPGLSTPTGLCIDNSAHRIFVLNYDMGIVSIID
jgi:YVTN family beta-propeller protein